MKKTVKFRSIFAVMAAAAFASCVFAGCTGSENKSGESSALSSAVSSAADVDSETVSSKTNDESMEESDVDSEDITFEVKSDDNPSKNTSSTIDNTSLEESSEKLTPFQAVRFGRTLSHVFTNETDKYDSHHISPNINICILNINDDNTYDIYAFGYSLPVNTDDIELYPEDYVPDFKNDLWFGIENEYRI